MCNTGNQVDDLKDPTFRRFVPSISSDVLDYSGNARNGYLVGANRPDFVSSPFTGFNKAVLFTGVEAQQNSQGVVIPYSFGAQNTIDVSLFIMVTSDGYILEQGESNSVATDYYMIFQGGKLFCSFGHNGINRTMNLDETGNPFAFNKVYYIQFVYRFYGVDSVECAIFCNGVRLDYVISTGFTIGTFTNSFLYLGRADRRNSPTSDTMPFGGWADELKVSNEFTIDPTQSTAPVPASEYLSLGDGLYHLNGPDTIGDFATESTLRLINADLGTISKEFGIPGYSAGSSGTITLAGNKRVTGIACYSSSGGYLSVNSGDHVPIVAGQCVNWEPKGNYVDPTIVFSATDSYIVEYVT